MGAVGKIGVGCPKSRREGSGKLSWFSLFCVRWMEGEGKVYCSILVDGVEGGDFYQSVFHGAQKWNGMEGVRMCMCMVWYGT